MSDLVIVSGAARSGTSMAMQMLEAGGLRVFVDPITRAPNLFNAGGNYEASAVSRGMDWIPQAKGGAVKVLLRNLQRLPADVSADLIWMDRPEADVAASWLHMVTFQRQFPAGLQPPRSGLDLRKEVHAWAKQRPGFRVLNLSYNMVVDNPEKAAHRIAKFLDRDMDLAAMAAIPRASERHFHTAAE